MGKIKFRLPKLHGLLATSSDLEDNDFSKLVHVKDGYAFVLNGGLFACVYLRDYVKLTCKLEETEDIVKMDEILDFLSEKSYTKKFWAELTDLAEVDLNVDELEVHPNHYKKTLTYDPVEPLVSKLLDIRKELGRDIKPFEQCSLPGISVAALVSTFSAELKKDSILVRSTGIEHCLHFCFLSQNHIFGYVLTDYDGTNEVFDNFENLQELSEILAEA